MLTHASGPRRGRRSPVSPLSLLSPLRAIAFALLSPALAAAVDGAPDDTFSGDGVALWSSGGTVVVHDAVATDTRLIAVGSLDPVSATEAGLHWQAVTVDGTIDTNHSCVGASSTLLPFSTSSRGRAAWIDSSGRLLVGGSVNYGTEQEFALLARFDIASAGCNLDPDFSTSGWEVFDDGDYCATADCEIEAVEEISLLTGGVTAPRLVLLLRAEVNFLDNRYFLLGLHEDGTFDSSFGVNGVREIFEAAVGDLNRARMAIDGLGRIYVFASAWDPSEAADLDLYLLRYDAGGDLDPTFETAGIYTVDDDDADDTQVVDLVANPDGSVAVTLEENGLGYLRAFDFELQSGILAGLDLVNARVRVQGNERLVVAGDFPPASAIEGFEALRRTFHIGHVAFIPDSTFGVANGRVAYDVDNGGSNSDEVAALLLWHGRPVIAGTAANAIGSSGFVLRAQNAYIFADGFDAGGAAFWSAGTGFAPLF